MKVTYRGHVEKVDLCNKKTKIYQTIEGLIILFIKLQFSIRCNHAFRLLRTSTSKHLPQLPNIYLNLSLNPNGLMASLLASSPMHSYHPQYASWFQTYTQQRSLYLIKSGSGLRTRQGWELLVYPPRDFCHSCHCFDIPEDKTDVRIKEKSYLHPAGLLSTPPPRGAWE